MTALTQKEQILAAEDREIVEVEVPEWALNGEEFIVLLMEISSDDKESWERTLFNEDAKGRKLAQSKYTRARLIAQCLVDTETKERMFPDVEIPKLARKGSKVIERLFEKCLTLNAFTKKDVDDLEEN